MIVIHLDGRGCFKVFRGMYSQGDSTGDKGKLEIQALPESRTLRRRFRLMAGDGDVLGLDWLCVYLERFPKRRW